MKRRITYVEGKGGNITYRMNLEVFLKKFDLPPSL